MSKPKAEEQIVDLFEALKQSLAEARAAEKPKEHVKHVRKPMLGGGNSFYAKRKGGPHQTLCGAQATIHDLPFKAFHTPVGVERLGPGLCPDCVRLRLEASHRPQQNQKLLKRAARAAARSESEQCQK